MQFDFDLSSDTVRIRTPYVNFSFNIYDINTVLKYIQHRYKTSKLYYVALYRQDFARNKLFRELRFPKSFYGGNFDKPNLKVLIDDLLEFKNSLETNLELLPMKMVRAIYKSKVGV